VDLCQRFMICPDGVILNYAHGQVDLYLSLLSLL
jgi:hypothetical protein